jgi:DNA-3-methyladenine glycosylase II
MERFELQVPMDFSLRAASGFLLGFCPARGSSVVGDDALALGFRLDGTFAPVAVALTQPARGVLAGECTGAGAALDAVTRQVARILSLDTDPSGAGFRAVGRRDPVVGALQARFAGFRPVVFSSPYEAAVWGILAQRTSMAQAAAVRAAVAAEHGDALRVGGMDVQLVPAPERWLGLRALRGVSAEKLARIQGVAAAALRGELEAEQLRGRPGPLVLAELQRLRGVGAWTAAHMLTRGAGTVDELPTAEPRVLRGAALAYGLPRTPSPSEFAALAQAWRPFRTWVAILMVRALAGTTGWHGPEARGARVAARGPARRATPAAQSLLLAPRSGLDAQR